SRSRLAARVIDGGARKRDSPLPTCSVLFAGPRRGESMSQFSTKVVEVDGRWSLRVRTECGLKLEYLYETERQARFFRAVFALDPTRLPPPQRMELGAREKARTGLERA